MDKLINYLLDGDQKSAVQEAESLLEKGVTKPFIISDGIENAMSRLDEKCTIEQFNLLEIMLCGRAVMSVMKMLYPDADTQPSTKGTVVLAALEGDVHDLGKNIVKMIFSSSGYKVIDCGKDCSLDSLIETVFSNNADAIGVSGLITTIVPRVREIRSKLDKYKLDSKVIAGGAALKMLTAEQLNVDYVAENVFDGLRFLKSIKSIL